MSKQLWVIDPVHSDIMFKVRHMMITNVSGVFDQFNGVMHSNAADFSDADISFEAEVSSINTRNEQRDEHLKSADFFDVANHPKLTFKSTGLTKKSENSYELVGDLSLRGVSKTLKLDVEFNGVVIDPWGQVKAGFEMNGIIKRADYGLMWNAQSEDGSVVLSEDVRLQITVQMIKQL